MTRLLSIIMKIILCYIDSVVYQCSRYQQRGWVDFVPQFPADQDFLAQRIDTFLSRLKSRYH